MVEHALVTDASLSERAVRNGFGITVQHALLWNMGSDGAEHAIDVATALRLYTVGTADLLGEADRLGRIAPGMLADLVGYPLDPLTADPDDLKDLTPAFTIVGGQPIHESDQLAR